MRFIKILAIVGAGCFAGIVFMLFRETKRADYWANFERTRNARLARHKKPDAELTSQAETELENLNVDTNAENN